MGRVPVLMHANNEGIDHLESAITGSGESVYIQLHTPARPPANETIVVSGVGTEGIRQIAPGCSRSPARLRTPRSFTRGTPRALFSSFGLIATRSKRDQGAWHGFGPGAALIVEADGGQLWATVCELHGSCRARRDVVIVGEPARDVAFHCPAYPYGMRAQGPSNEGILSSLFLAQINHEPALCRARRDACCHSI